MRKLSVFNHVTLDGYFTDAKGEMSWAHKSDPEWDEFVQANAGAGGTLLFGRVTYDMMAGFWPTPEAAKRMPVIAERMNTLPKIVFSKSMKAASWHNTTIVTGNITAEMRKIKDAPGPDMVIFGSGTIVSQFAQAGLIDEYKVVVNPIVIGSGRTMFDSVKDRVPLTLTSSRVFGNGNVLLSYAAKG